METKFFNLPNAITLLRIFLIPIFILLLVSPTPFKSIVSAVVFSLAAFTDWLDGYIARRSGQITKLGILLDPIADKLLISASLILLVDMDRIPSWIAVVIIGREFGVTGLRAIAFSKGNVISAEIAGKIKMITQILAVIFLLISGKHLGLDLFLIGTVALWIAMILSVISAVRYFIVFWKQIDIT
ncbi:MAG: CDP-diacylglycerol--glycerol-3-phosphate 3-phosphatidyltransferase [Nitrospirota bacterium]